MWIFPVRYVFSLLWFWGWGQTPWIKALNSTRFDLSFLVGLSGWCFVSSWNTLDQAHSSSNWTKHTKTLLRLPVPTKWTIPSRHSRSQKLPGKTPLIILLCMHAACMYIIFDRSYSYKIYTLSLAVLPYPAQKASLMGKHLFWLIIYITSQSKVRYHDEVSLNAKAWNGRVICCWLAEAMVLAARGVPLGYDEGRLSLVCYALILGKST